MTSSILNGPIFGALLRAADLPAREALELARRSWLASVVRAGAGLAAIAGATVAARGLDGAAPGLFGLGRADSFRAALEAIAVVTPALVVAAGYFGLKLSPRIVVAAISLGLTAGALVAVALLPLCAFLALTNRLPGNAGPPLALLVTTAALGAVVAIPVRVTAALDDSRLATWIARGYGLALFGAFFGRIWRLS